MSNTLLLLWYNIFNKNIICAKFIWIAFFRAIMYIKIKIPFEEIGVPDAKKELMFSSGAESGCDNLENWYLIYFQDKLK